METTLLVNEIFGPTFQGEGPSAGRHCMFVRLFNCNLECKWCDTSYTWAVTPSKAAKHNDKKQYVRAEQAHEMTIREILHVLESKWDIWQNPTTITISGGEPLMQQTSLAELGLALEHMDCPMHIETAGTIVPIPALAIYVARYVVSPKLSNSGNLESKRLKPKALEWFAESSRTWFKFVVTCQNDLDEVDEIVNKFDIRREKVMIMPEGITAGHILEGAQRMSEAVLERGYGLSLRNHVLIWGNVRER